MQVQIICLGLHPSELLNRMPEIAKSQTPGCLTREEKANTT
jgi:hypothetical protein